MCVHAFSFLGITLLQIHRDLQHLRFWARFFGFVVIMPAGRGFIWECSEPKPAFLGSCSIPGVFGGVLNGGFGFLVSCLDVCEVSLFFSWVVSSGNHSNNHGLLDPQNGGCLFGFPIKPQKTGYSFHLVYLKKGQPGSLRLKNGEPVDANQILLQ